MRRGVVFVIAVSIVVLVLLEAGLRLAGPVLICPKERSEAGSAGGRAPYRILCIGESTTDGEYPRFLAEALRAQDKTREYIVIDEGHGRATTDYLLAELEDNLALYQPDMIIAMMGKYDQSDEVVYERVPRENLLRVLKTYRMLTVLAKHMPGALRRIFLRTSGADDNKALTGEGLNDQERDLFRQGNRFFDEKDYEKAQGYFRKMLEIRPSDMAYIGVARSATRSGRYAQAVRACRKAIEVNPHNEEIYIELALCYRMMEDRTKEGAAYLKALEINPDSKKVHKYVNLFYFLQKRFPEYMAAHAEAVRLKTLTRKDETGSVLSGHLRRLCFFINQDDAEIREKNIAGEVPGDGFEWYKRSTVYNYRKLGRIAKEKGIRLVCMQYPGAPLAPLKKIFNDADSILFVDNEALFAKAIKQKGYGAYFQEEKYCHYTQEANKLLAENLAEVITPPEELR